MTAQETGVKRRTVETLRGVRVKRVPLVLATLALVASSVVVFGSPASAGMPQPNVTRILNYQTGLCLTPRDSAGNPEFVAVTYCNVDRNDKSQDWVFYPDSIDPSYYHLSHLVNGVTTYCLAVRNFGPYPYLAVSAACGHWADQEWFIHFRKPNVFIMQSKSTGQYLVPQSANNWADVGTQPAQGINLEAWQQS